MFVQGAFPRKVTANCQQTLQAVPGHSLIIKASDLRLIEGEIVKAMTRRAAVAALGLSLIQILAFTTVHLPKKEYNVLPVNLVGIALVVLGMILFVAELFVESGGILGIGGTAAVVAHCVQQGVECLRVHDVSACRQAALIAKAIRSEQ